jgi:SulP family sulfate permease
MLPLLQWLPDYTRQTFSGDIVAGITVAIMIIPQSMAYALLAGLSPEIGLYASIVPMMLYALFGSSRYLAVGPVALVSLMTASVMGEVAASGNVDYHTGALIIALLSGILLLVMSLARLGVLATLLSKPILSGFTSAAAIIIGMSQLKYLLGMTIPSGLNPFEKLYYALMHWQESNLLALFVGLASIVIILSSGGVLKRFLTQLKLSVIFINVMSKLGPLFAVALFTIASWHFAWHDAYNLRIVGDIPSGLPSFGMPSLNQDLIWELLGPALLIALVGTIESISIAKSLASKEREKIEPNKELFGLGMANLGASFTGAYPITGGLSRSIVNYSAGAQTPFASIFTGLIVLTVVLFLTSWFYYLPLAVLSSIVIIAVTKLFDMKGLMAIWRYNKGDAISMLVTFFIVLFMGVELGILVGVVLSVLFFLLRTSQPHVAVLGRVGNNGHFRNVLRYDTQDTPHLLALRIDESLFFVNASYIENLISNKVAKHPEIKHLILVCSGINFIDSSALETLEHLSEQLKAAGTTLHLAEVKGPVMDKLSQTPFIEQLQGQVFLSTHDAFMALETIDKGVESQVKNIKSASL